MVETHNPTEVEDLLQRQPNGELTAILTPTKMDIIKFTEALATALTSCNSKKAITGGQAYLVLTEAEFKLRVQSDNVRYPTRPLRPADYDDDKFESKSWKKHKHALAMFVETEQYDHQIINLIKTKFPQGLDGLYDDNDNLKLGTTALQAIQQVSKNILDKTETT